MAEKTFTIIDLFAGIGGFHQGLASNGGKCVFASEWAKDPLCWKDIQSADIPMPASAQQCLIAKDVWERTQSTGRNYFRANLEQEEQNTKLNVLCDLGVDGLRTALFLIGEYPIGVADEEREKFVEILGELSKKSIRDISNAKREKLIDVLRKIYDFDHKFYPNMRGI